MISIRVQVRLEELAQQYFPSLSITNITQYPSTSDEWDTYIMELDDGRSYWAFDDHQDFFLLNCSGLYEDFENAYDAMLQMIKNSQEIQEEMNEDRMTQYENR